jgi:hypothetical protein
MTTGTTFIEKPLIGTGVCPYCLAWQTLFCNTQYDVVREDFFCGSIFQYI